MSPEKKFKEIDIRLWIALFLVLALIALLLQNAQF
jgi:hypothetical protein